MENVQDKLKAWLIACVQGIVSQPESVTVEASDDAMGLFFVVRVHEDDRGKVIGKDGRHAESLRTLLRCAGGNNEVRASLKVEVPGSKFKPTRSEE